MEAMKEEEELKVLASHSKMICSLLLIKKFRNLQKLNKVSGKSALFAFFQLEVFFAICKFFRGFQHKTKHPTKLFHLYKRQKQRKDFCRTSVVLLFRRVQYW